MCLVTQFVDGKKKLDSRLEMIENAPKSEMPKSASSDDIVSKVKEIVKRYARYTLRDKPMFLVSRRQEFTTF